MMKNKQLQNVSGDGLLTIQSSINCRAPPERCRNAGGKKDPRVFFICTKGEAGCKGATPIQRGFNSIMAPIGARAASMTCASTAAAAAR
jgi:hypothetical protein